MVFTDESARKDLEAIVHPAVGMEMVRRLQEHAGTDSVVVYDVPLLVESGKTGYGAVVVVDVDPDIAVARLVAHRGFDEADAGPGSPTRSTGRPASPSPTAWSTTPATMEALEAQVDEVWAWLVERQREAGVAAAAHPTDTPEP